ncbi:MAG: zinc ribbon domain-containing protein [Acidobacteria bacterium]|nr:zinc ribbon domain-containing protein [Acidobacteriota bacterium]
MHCPRCGQQQVSEEIKFCSRCGFPLGLVSEILAHGGFLPQLADLHQGKKKFTRKLGLKIALIWFLFIVFILVPLAGITGAPGEAIGGLSVIGVCGALVMMVLSFLFLENDPKYPIQAADPNPQTFPGKLTGNVGGNALPPATSRPVSSYVPPAAGSWKAPDTGDLVPRSVTEETTKLLHKED